MSKCRYELARSIELGVEDGVDPNDCGRRKRSKDTIEDNIAAASDARSRRFVSRDMSTSSRP